MVGLLLSKKALYVIGIIILLIGGVVVYNHFKKEPEHVVEDKGQPHINQVVEVANTGAKDIAEIGIKAVEKTIEVHKKTEKKKEEVVKQAEEKKAELIESHEEDPDILGKEAAKALGLEYIDNDQ
jgi:hypothetical protein